MNERVVLDLKQFGGAHCQSTALRSVLSCEGVDVTEEMILGLGGGVGFIYWHMKQMNAPFTGFRNAKAEDFILNACGRLGIKARITATASEKKSYAGLMSVLKSGHPAYVFVDMPYLPYLAFPAVEHFGGHTVAVYGLDEGTNTAYIGDRACKGVTAPIDALIKARASKHPPFPAKNKALEITYPVRVKITRENIKAAISECVRAMTDPPISNLGLAGIKKWAGLIDKWPAQFKADGLLNCLMNVFIYMEIGGTGGGAFRPMYAGFLRQAKPIMKNPALEEAAALFDVSAKACVKTVVSALPDNAEPLRKLRELFIYKNRVFEAQEKGALDIMTSSAGLEKELITQGIEFMKTKDAKNVLQGLKENVIKLKETETKAFAKLKEVC